MEVNREKGQHPDQEEGREREGPDQDQGTGEIRKKRELREDAGLLQEISPGKKRGEDLCPGSDIKVHCRNQLVEIRSQGDLSHCLQQD